MIGYYTVLDKKLDIIGTSNNPKEFGYVPLEEEYTAILCLPEAPDPEEENPELCMGFAMKKEEADELLSDMNPTWVTGLGAGSYPKEYQVNGSLPQVYQWLWDGIPSKSPTLVLCGLIVWDAKKPVPDDWDLLVGCPVYLDSWGLGIQSEDTSYWECDFLLVQNFLKKFYYNSEDYSESIGTTPPPHHKKWVQVNPKKYILEVTNVDG